MNNGLLHLLYIVYKMLITNVKHILYEHPYTETLGPELTAYMTRVT